MNMKPILFNTNMVRALLANRKTVTRRVVKPQPEGAHSILDCDEEKRTFDLLCGNGGVGGVFVDWAETIKAPFWPRDILYVRETWDEVGWFSPGIGEWNQQYIYRASYQPNLEADVPTIKWRPSIHMPREAARIFLRVTDVRMERLQDITELDILEKEGITVDFPRPKPSYMSFAYAETRLKPAVKKAFAAFWDSAIKPADRAIYGWDANPYVWVIEFERCEKPEEEPS